MTFLHLAHLGLPAELSDEAERVSAKLMSALDEQQRRALDTQLKQSPQLATQLGCTLIGSQYVLDCCCREPDLLFHCLLSDVAFEAITPVKIIDAIETVCSDPLSLETLDTVLRHQRRRFMVGLYWRHLNRLADFAEISQGMTALAEVCIQQALNFHYQQLVEKHGVPIGQDSQQPQPLLVLGMGKLGGAELNMSSDIDLIFVFPEAGSTDQPKFSIDNQQFFTLLGKRLIKSLNENTVDGFVFRVDMRLRPYGQSGALVSNFNALENYYHTQGRDWERFAAIKARVVACSQVNHSAQSFAVERQAIDDLYKILRPFVYRKYIDFSTVDSLRRLKAMIVQEVRRKGLDDDVKLGAGGIREIEFIAQSFQLIRGGRDSRLQEKHLLNVLQQLMALNNLAEDVVDGLTEAYLFLRHTEHMIQAWQDAQTQCLPRDSLGQSRLAWLMGFENWAAYWAQLNLHRDFVSHAFREVIAEPDEKNQIEVDVEWQSFWALLFNDTEESQKEFIAQKGFIDTDGSLQALRNFTESRSVQSLSSASREKLNLFIPQLLHAISIAELPDLALTRLLNWLERIVTRTSYIVLLLENPQVCHHLVKLFGASSWIASLLTQTPSLLDELLFPENLFDLPERSVLRDELRQRLLRLEPDDMEAHMETLRYFRLAHNLHVAACEVMGALPLMKVSDYLTYTAEVILEQVLQLAWATLTARHGLPSGLTADEMGFIIVGYGKLGGIEMSYSSDLDLVFIYQADAQGMTTGDKPIDHQTFYTRLGQKIIHILNTRTLSGQLYEVDMRLRPSGNSGLLVTSLAAYTRYQKQEAWMWEHQALVRARPIAGDQNLTESFVNLRREVLSQPRELSELKQSVREMRQKMRDNLGTSSNSTKNGDKSSQFHLKQDTGGIVDIEFMVQYAVLAWSHQLPAISEWTDNIRILESLQKNGFIEPEQANQLIEIYQSYRIYSHRLVLKEQASSIIRGDLFSVEREKVTDFWNRLLSEH